MLLRKRPELPHPHKIGERKFEGTSFDVFDPSCIVRPSAYETSAFTNGPDVFVRSIRTSDTNTHAQHFSLPEFLKHSSTLFDKVANVCGATVVEHEWCLTPGVAGPNEGLGFFPDGFVLAAKVRTIRDAVRLSDLEERMLTHMLGTIDYTAEPFVWYDDQGEQFLATKDGIVLGDVDLIMTPYR